jgi:hypothetical protein
MKAFYILLTALLLCPALSFSQFFTVDTLRDESPYNKEFSFIFPVLKSNAKPDVATAINNDLISNVLKIEAGQQKRSLFENIWGKKEMDIPEVSDISFNVINNNADFFCISISATECTDVCENWTRYYTYDGTSGKKVTLGDVFNGAGVQMLVDSAKALKGQRIQEYTDTLKYALNKKALSDEDKKAYNDAIAAYDRCKQNFDPANVYSMDKAQVTLHIAHCLPYDIQFLDKIDRSFTFDLRALQNYLTDYGKSLTK